MSSDLVYFALFLIAIFLVASELYGSKYISSFIANVIPSATKVGWWDIF